MNLALMLPYRDVPGIATGLPLRWNDEESGELSAAIEAYLSHCISGTPLAEEQLTPGPGNFSIPSWFRLYGDRGQLYCSSSVVRGGEWPCKHAMALGEYYAQSIKFTDSMKISPAKQEVA